MINIKINMNVLIFKNNLNLKENKIKLKNLKFNEP